MCVVGNGALTSEFDVGYDDTVDVVGGKEDAYCDS